MADDKAATTPAAPTTTAEASSSTAPAAAPATTATTNEPIQAAEETGANDDADSALGDDDVESSTASLNSSIFEYRKIQGRTFHRETGNASYWGTNDAGHNESLDVLHHLFTLMLDGELFLAPIGEPKKVLDVGTGTGIWAIDMADKFPDCEVIGTDVSPIQPSWVPPNVRFEIEDCTQEWTFRANDFDFVHIRYLLGCIIDWTAFFKEAYRALKPGAYLESYEASPVVTADDGTLPEDSALSQWGPLFTEGGKKIGRSFTICDDDTQLNAMKEAGFVDVQDRWMKVPAGSWPADPKLRQIGEVASFAVLSDPESFVLFLTNILQWTREETQVYIARIRRELRSGKHHVYYRQRVIYGRKPETA